MACVNALDGIPISEIEAAYAGFQWMAHENLLKVVQRQVDRENRALMEARKR
jgi:hypothetical protein